MNKPVLLLSEANDSDVAGGKGASLSRLIAAGFIVPDGFVVTTSAQTMTAELEKEILSKFDGLDSKYVAVRSSAAAEDGAKDTWAGQLDTFLNVARQDLINKIIQCWKSARSERATSYAEQRGLAAGNAAVIVQAMVIGEISGVAFSAHPLTNNREQVVIEAVRGLGEQLVSGMATPDTYVIDKASGEIAEKHLNEDRQIMPEGQIKELVRVVKKIEEFFDFPVDVEWTFADNKLFILQSRPITTLG